MFGKRKKLSRSPTIWCGGKRLITPAGNPRNESQDSRGRRFFVSTAGFLVPLVHCFTYIPSAVEAPRAQWQGARREHSLSPTRPTSNAGNASAPPQPSGPGLFSAHPASLSRHVSHRICSSFDSLLEPKIASGRAWDIRETVH